MNDQSPVKTISIDAPAHNEPPEIQIPVENNAFLEFVKKRKIFLFIGLGVLTLGVVAFLAQPGSEVKTQLIPDNNSAVVIPSDPNEEIPPTALSTNENTNQTNQNASPLIGLTTDPIVPATVENKNTNAANTNANKKYTFVHASAPEATSGTGTVNYDPSHEKFLTDLDQQGQKTNLHPGAPISGGKSTRSGPETEIAFLLSGVVGFLFLLLSKRKQKLNSLR